MIELLAEKSATGDLFINLAKLPLDDHEWGKARMAIQEGLAKGRLSDQEHAPSDVAGCLPAHGRIARPAFFFRPLVQVTEQ